MSALTDFITSIYSQASASQPAAGNHEHIGALVAVTDATTAYTLVLTDAGKVVRMTHASASTVTVPPNSSVAFEIGTVINIYSAGAGGCTPTAGGGVTIRNNATPLVQYKECSLRKDGTDEWVRAG